ncbi:methylated-DNA--[protein]-cysteine S-methyltransferase [Mucilaginibacter limnophilus]|uniref:Methylated-DNA--protein-cysteine methyltransferase n=1 Tax=Mucilaginibacter limnophilus TaxID=1932778 RepID=A0A3S2UNC0_9SPHI|nr:methylated-DNA--[protein]-cysteine S-methyltransferase [Mucilaginibacter limnophilus]RVU02650.1 methylated-DNA--[protein]-cysteine S-methyltransferase [Mucilaginibacter limnophilus]
MPVLYYKTPVGIARIIEEDGAIVSISIRDEELEANEPETELLKTVSLQFDEYFEGKRMVFDFPINQPGTAFQQRVWQYLLQIPYGTTTSYGAMSRAMNDPLAIRAIASANGKNNLWIVVPCHRVIGSNGSLTGYAGGLWRKQWLLEHEARTIGTGQTKLAF